MNVNKSKALVLFSGGLDSLLAAKIIRAQNIEVHGINYYIGFNDNSGILKLAEQLAIKVHIVDMVDEYKDTLIAPKFGYGANLNPCLDCKIFMVKKALEFAKENGFDFIVSGEVVGQRPKSQKRCYMNAVENQTNAAGLLLRPLSAKLLPPTIPEINGWVDREQLYGFSGRSRKPQLELIKKFGINNFPQPSGGCLLTDNKYCQRLHDLWQTRGNKDYSREDVELLKIGRHLRLNKNCKVIIARNDSENDLLEKYCNNHISLFSVNNDGPLALIEGITQNAEILWAARIVARYSRSHNLDQVQIKVNYLEGKSEILAVLPFKPEEILQSWYI